MNAYVAVRAVRKIAYIIQERNTMEDFGFMEMQKLQRELQEKYG